jgi:trimethylamine---corrinoid protein Co-methyltransferase
MQISIKVFEDNELGKIHDYTLKLLESPGMRIHHDGMIDALAKKGAKVDFAEKTVSFTHKIIEETIRLMKKDNEEGRIARYLNGVTSELTGKQGIQAKFGGACIQFLDWKNRTFRDPTEVDLINMVKLGQALPEVATVGNPVVYVKDKYGREIEPRLQRIKTAALVAKYTDKPGSTEVWNTKELEFLIEIGYVVRGSREAYFQNPCFITAKETIAPFILEENAAEVLLALASKDLPCLIIPMPISGVSSPVSLFSNVLIGNAEILATAAAIKAIYPKARIVGGIISGSMDMSTGTANFGTPEAILQDMGLAEVYERLYGFNFGIGCYFDAKYPGIQNVIEKTFKYFALAAKNRYTYAVGLVNGGKCFSAEQAVIDIQVLQNIHKFLEGISVIDKEEQLELIRDVGIGGSFLQENNTLLNYRKYLMVPELFDHTLSQGLEKDLNNDILLKANKKVEKIISSPDLYEIDEARAKEIDAIVNKAEKYL